MTETAIPHAPIANIQNVAHDAERRSLLLNRCSEVDSVVCSCCLHVHGPAGIDVTRIHVKGKDEVFLGSAAVGSDHCVQKERARSKIDNGRAGDAHGIELSAYEILRRHRRANVALPDNAPIDRIKRVDIIRFGRRDNHRPATRTVLDVKRLRINVAGNCAVKVQVARQISGGGWREGRINVKPITRIMIVKLGDVHLCICRGDCA